MADRVETGIVQFDDDWPGIFIRGDDAFMYASALANPTDPIFKHYVDGLKELLASADVRQHQPSEVQHVTTHKAG